MKIHYTANWKESQVKINNLYYPFFFKIFLRDYMIVKTALFNSTTDDLTIVIDLLRASTTICVALNNFKKVI